MANRFTSSESFDQNVGKTITIWGRVSDIQWQHMIQLQADYPEISYVDLIDWDGSTGFQFVVYSNEELPHDCDLELTGTLIQIGGDSKHPDKERCKYYSEYQFIAEKIIPIKNK